MAKNLYSLMLSQEVVNAVDAAAHRMGTSRSALIDSVLANHLGVSTPEILARSIFQAMEDLVRPSQNLVALLAPNNSSLAVKSSLNYKYRPSIKYEIAIDTSAMNAQLCVGMRTQSQALIYQLAVFFKLWNCLEQTYCAPCLGHEIEAIYVNGKYIRKIYFENLQGFSADTIAEIFSDYISFLDLRLRAFLEERESAEEIEERFLRRLQTKQIYF